MSTKVKGQVSAQIDIKQMLAEGIKLLPIEKRREIVDLLSEACMAVNTVECRLIGTDLEHQGLFDGEEHPTLWSQIYALKKMFLDV